MLPTITLGSSQISTYVLMYSLAFFVFTSLSLADLRGGIGDPRKDNLVRFGVLAVAVAFMAGQYIPGLFQSLLESARTGQPIAQPQARVYYGLATAVLTGIAIGRGRLSGADLYRIADRIFVYFPLVYAIARLGCLAAGCCGGAETDSALGMHAPDDHGQWANRYPTQLMSGGVQLGLFVFFFWLSRWREKPPIQGGWKAWLNRPGAIFWLYLLAFAVERFSMDFLRYDYRPLWGPLSLPQLLMLAVMAGAAVWLTRSRWAAPNL